MIRFIKSTSLKKIKKICASCLSKVLVKFSKNGVLSDDYSDQALITFVVQVPLGAEHVLAQRSVVEQRVESILIATLQKIASDESNKALKSALNQIFVDKEGSAGLGLAAARVRDLNSVDSMFMVITGVANNALLVENLIEKSKDALGIPSFNDPFQAMSSQPNELKVTQEPVEAQEFMIRAVKATSTEGHVPTFPFDANPAHFFSYLLPGPGGYSSLHARDCVARLTLLHMFTFLPQMEVEIFLTPEFGDPSKHPDLFESVNYHRMVQFLNLMRVKGVSFSLSSTASKKDRKGDSGRSKKGGDKGQKGGKRSGGGGELRRRTMTIEASK